MAQAGQCITNPITGERITFLETEDDTGGAHMRFDCWVPPGGVRLPPHVHRTCAEHFAVISGTLGVMRGGRHELLRAGQCILLPAMIAHQWWNAGDDSVRFEVTVTPPRNLEAVLEAICGMAQAGRLNGLCLPKNPFELVSFARYAESYLPAVPIWVQRGALALFARMGALLGYRADFAAYRRVVAPPTALTPLIVAQSAASEGIAA